MRKHLRSPSPLGDGWFTYDIRDIAIYVINYCNKHNKQINKHNKQITNTQLNHLLYKIQAGFLTYLYRCCFLETFQKGYTGPIQPAIYKTYRIYKRNPIPVQPYRTTLYLDKTLCQIKTKTVRFEDTKHLPHKIFLERIIDDHDFTSQTYTDELLATRSICDDISHKELYEYYKNHKDSLVTPVQKSRLS